MQRPDKTSAKKVHALKSATLLITGDNSPHQDDVVNTNSRLDPEISNYFKVSESGGMPLEEQPHKVATSLILFLQGLGYCKLLILYTLYSGIQIYNHVSSITMNIISPGKSYRKIYGTEPRYNNLRYNHVPDMAMRI